MTLRLLAATLAAAGFVALLGGCATPTLSAGDSRQYAEMSLPEFLKARFQDRQSLAVKNTIRYLAFFNDSNYRQLERPTQELWTFCLAGGGKPARTEAHAGDPVGRFFSTPEKAAWAGAFYATAAGRPDLAQATANNAVLLNEDFKARYNAADAKAAFDAVRAKGAYGTWECRYEAGQRRNWHASVLPIGYVPSSNPANLLTNHRMVLEITPYQD